MRGVLQRKLLKRETLRSASRHEQLLRRGKTANPDDFFVTGGSAGDDRPGAALRGRNLSLLEKFFELAWSTGVLRPETVAGAPIANLQLPGEASRVVSPVRMFWGNGANDGPKNGSRFSHHDL